MSDSDSLEHESQQPLAKKVKVRHDTRPSDSSQEVNDKQRERQQRYREQNREKLKQREAERRKRKQKLQITGELSTDTSSNVNIIELNNEELSHRYSQSFSDLRRIQTSSVEGHEEAEEKDALQKKKERQQRYREQNREKLKRREAERRKRKQSLQMTAETSSSPNIDCIENIISEVEVDDERSATGLEDTQNTFLVLTERKSSPNAPLAPTLLETGINESTSSEPVVKPIIQNSWLALNPMSQSPGLQEIPILIHNKDSSSSKAFSPDENSSYFQFFRSIHNDYLELPAKKQRQFKRRCLSFLHELLDDEDNDQPTHAYPHQANVLNLSHSGHVSEDDKDVKPVVEDGHILPDM